MSYHVGDVVTIDGAWTDKAGAAIDPTAVFCEVKDPSANLSTLTYGVDAALVRDSTGLYHVDVDADEAGCWQYRFWSTGSGQAASRVAAFIVFAVTFA